MELINNFLHHKDACQLLRGKPACALMAILGKVDRLFFSSSRFVDGCSASPPHTWQAQRMYCNWISLMFESLRQ